MRMTWQQATTVAAVAAIGAACAPPPSTTPGGGDASPTAASADPAAPTADTPTTDAATPVNSTQQRIDAVLGRLPACVDDERDTTTADDVDGLVLPETSRVVDVSVDGNLTTVEARVARTPVEIRQFYEYQNLGVLKTLMIEDEILEAEALMESRTHRMFVKAQAVCPTGSILYVVVAPGGADARLPQPGDPDAPGTPLETP